jgi:DNA polymerase-3 subunit epsilon
VGTLDPLSQPLHAVTFCVVDLETTGGSPTTDTITEVGAVTYRGGERLGTLQTLVNPCAPLPAEITALTGITPAMLGPAPTIAQVLPSLAEFVGGAVLVGHNLRFDTSFLDAALAATGRSLLDHLRVDTVPLARRLLGGDVPDCKLGTLAAHLGLGHRPTHRALDDALATAELLHLLLERAAAFGVTLLDDLLSLPGVIGHGQAAKLRLTTRLPRAPGAYLVRNRRGEPVAGGHGPDVRRQVRSYFSAMPAVAEADRRRVGSVLREAHSFESLRCASGLDATVAATRLAHALAPRHGVASGSATSERPDRAWAAPAGPGEARWVALTGGAAGRLVVGRQPLAGARAEVGPMPRTQARRLIPALEAAAEAAVDRVDAIIAGLGGRPDVLVEPLDRRATALAAEGRHAAAAITRGQVDDLVAALERQRRVGAVRRSDRLVLGLPGGGRAELVRGRLVRTWHADRSSTVWSSGALQPGAGPLGGAGDGPPAAEHPSPGVAPLADGATPGGSGSGRGEAIAAARAHLGDLRLDDVTPPPRGGALAADAADELLAVAAWLDDHAAATRLLYVEAELSSPLPRLAPTATAADDPGREEPLRCAPC